MKQIKIFKATNNDLLATQNEINRWVEDNNIDILNISTTNGATYTGKNSSYVLEVEIFIIVLYTIND